MIQAIKPKIIGTFAGIILVGCLVFILKPYAEDFWARFMDFTNPQYFKQVEARWSGKSSNFLISKLGHPSYIYDGVAVVILSKRKDLLQTQLDKIEKIARSDSNYRGQVSALSLLFGLSPDRTVSLSMEIVKLGRQHPLYSDVLRHLARIKYEPAFDYVLNLANETDPFSNGSIGMLKDFEKVEAIPVLEKMIDKIRTQDKMVARIDHSSILDAVQSIKEKNNIST